MLNSLVSFCLGFHLFSSTILCANQIYPARRSNNQPQLTGLYEVSYKGDSKPVTLFVRKKLWACKHSSLIFPVNAPLYLKLQNSHTINVTKAHSQKTMRQRNSAQHILPTVEENVRIVYVTMVKRDPFLSGECVLLPQCFHTKQA